MRTRCITIAAVLVGCGPDDVVEAEQDEICGEPGPYRVLALDDGEVPYTQWISVRKVGDRVYYVIGDATDAPIEDEPFSRGLPGVENARIVSSGPCGESPRVVAEGYDAVSGAEWPEALIASSVAGGTFAIDPEGVEPPILLRPALQGFQTVELGAIGVIPDAPDATTGRLVLQPIPESIFDPLPPSTDLLAGVTTTIYPPFQASETEVLTVTADAELVRVDLLDGAVTSVAADIAYFDARSERWIGLMRTPDPNDPKGLMPTFMLDRESGEETKIGDAVHAGFGIGVDEVLIDIDPETGFGTRIVQLPSFVSVDIPAGISLSYRIADGRFFGYVEGQLALYDDRTGDVQILFAGGGVRITYPDAAIVLDVGWVSEVRETGTLWRAPFDGGDPERLARRASEAFVLRDDASVITPVDIDADLLGTLVRVEPTTLQEQRIDTQVFAADIDIAAADTFDAGVIAYSVRDGDRSGIWLAKPISD